MAQRDPGRLRLWLPSATVQGQNLGIKEDPDQGTVF